MNYQKQGHIINKDKWINVALALIIGMVLGWAITSNLQYRDCERLSNTEAEWYECDLKR